MDFKRYILQSNNNTDNSKSIEYQIVVMQSTNTAPTEVIKKDIRWKL